MNTSCRGRACLRFFRPPFTLPFPCVVAYHGVIQKSTLFFLEIHPGRRRAQLCDSHEAAGSLGGLGLDQKRGCVRSLLHHGYQASSHLEDWPPSLRANEAESGSLSLRLAGSPSRASAAELLPPPPRSATCRMSNDRVSYFQLTRSHRLILAHQVCATRNRVGR